MILTGCHRLSSIGKLTDHSSVRSTHRGCTSYLHQFCWTITRLLNHQGLYSLTDNGKVAEYRVVCHRAQFCRIEMVAVGDATQDCGADVLQALRIRAAQTVTASAKAVADTSSRRSVAATTSTRTPRIPVSSSASPATRNNSLPAPADKSTSRSKSESSRASPRATDPNSRGLVAPYCLSNSATRLSCCWRAARICNVAAVGSLILQG